MTGRAPKPAALRERPVSSWLAIGGAAVIAFCAVRAVVRGYVPLDDNAVTEARARDVLSVRSPLIGIVSSATNIGPGTVNHPGPMLFDLLAIPVRLFPNGTGVAIGVAAIHIAAMLALAWCSRRFLGEQGACVVVAVAAALVWSLGSETWFEVWQPVVPMLPFLLGLVALWGFAAGRDELAIPAVAAVTFAVQTHGSYLILGPTVTIAAIACRVAVRRDRPPRRRPLVGAAILAAVLWAKPMADQVAGTHNMTMLLEHASAGESGKSLGLVDGVRAAAMVLVKPPWWLRPGVDSSLPNGGGLVRTADGPVFDPNWIAFPVAALGLCVLMAALAAASVVAHRRGDRVVVAGAAIGAAAIVAAVVSLAGLPVDAFGFTAHKARWLWPIGAYLTAFGLAALLRSAVVANARQAAYATASVAAVALVATLPTSYQWVSPQQYMVQSQDAARELRDAVGAIEGRGVVFLDLSGRPFPDAFNDTVAAEMVARGISFKVEGDYVVAQYGRGRRLDPDDGVDLTVRTFAGWRASSVPASWEVLVDVSDGTQRVVLAVHPGLVSSSDEPTG